MEHGLVRNKGFDRKSAGTADFRCLIICLSIPASGNPAATWRAVFLLKVIKGEFRSSIGPAIMLDAIEAVVREGGTRSPEGGAGLAVASRTPFSIELWTPAYVRRVKSGLNRVAIEARPSPQGGSDVTYEITCRTWLLHRTALCFGLGLALVAARFLLFPDRMETAGLPMLPPAAFEAVFWGLALFIAAAWAPILLVLNRPTFHAELVNLLESVERRRDSD